VRRVQVQRVPVRARVQVPVPVPVPVPVRVRVRQVWLPRGVPLARLLASVQLWAPPEPGALLVRPVLRTSEALRVRSPQW